MIYVLFVVGFFLLIKGADLLVDGASVIAKKLHISRAVIGLTMVAFGTSIPEFVINIFASIQGNTDLAIGNVLGSNISNILLILGVSAMIYPISVNKNTAFREIPLSIGAAMVLAIIANDVMSELSFSSITRIDGLILISLLSFFLYDTFRITDKDKDIAERAYGNKDMTYVVSAFYVFGGLLCLTLGGKWIVDVAIKIAEVFNMSQSLIGLTIVAVGSSLPELATSAIAAYKKQPDLAIGNIIGSNIFNILGVLGVSAIIYPLPFDVVLNRDIFMVIFASMILLLLMFVGKKGVIERRQGVFMMTIYIGYVIFLVWTQ